MIPQGFPQTPTNKIRLSSGPVVYRTIGKGPPMLLVHGWGGSSRHWHMTMAGLADIRTIYALDLPGHGQSPPLNEPTSAERMAELVIEFADNVGVERFDLNGHSFGAAVAIYIAARYPERVQQVVLSCFGTYANEFEHLLVNMIYYQTYLPMLASHYWLGLLQPWQSLWQLWLTSLNSTVAVPWTVARPFFYEMPDDLVMIQEGYSEFMLMDPRTSLENTLSLGNPALRAAMAQIQAPTLLVGGQQDMIVPPEHLERAAEIIPTCHSELVEQCGHVPMIEQPEAYQRILHTFLTAPQQKNSPKRPAA
jgi:pimeloyl-ACP methyl ester carboxylesterase